MGSIRSHETFNVVDGTGTFAHAVGGGLLWGPVTDQGDSIFYRGVLRLA